MGEPVRISLLFAAVLLGLAVLSGNAQASSGHIYLLRGLANIFSTGLDTLDERLVQRGFAATVHNHIDYEALAAEAARLQKSGEGPIIIIGHSLGADAAIFMAEKMKAAGARVALVVTFGPTMNLTVPSNVSQVVNYYTGNTLVARGPGFKGTISNVNLNAAPDINHLNIEKSNRLHASVISKIQAIAGRGHLSRAAVVQ
jgi:thioesterase domain-containing protein